MREGGGGVGTQRWELAKWTEVLKCTVTGSIVVDW